ncbi:MAG: hypothetical protein JST49_15725 [Bacteroidetes bacterium]|nr:hypothetical protein [Bacteroidota bacterium]
MKKMFFTTAFNVMLAAFVFTSCESKQEKVADAQEEVQEAKQELSEAKAELNAEYPAYRTEVENRIKMNEERIAQLRKNIGNGGKPLDAERAKRIDELEQKNAQLRARLVGYETERSDWESFKREFNHDMDELGAAIENLGKDNKK